MSSNCKRVVLYSVLLVLFSMTGIAVDFPAGTGLPNSCEAEKPTNGITAPCSENSECTQTLCKLYIVPDQPNICNPDDLLNAISEPNGQIATCRLSCYNSDGSLKNECARYHRTGKFAVVSLDNDFGTVAKDCGLCDSLNYNMDSCKEENNKNNQIQKFYCQLPIISPEEYPNRCAAARDDDKNQQWDDGDNSVLASAQQRVWLAQSPSSYKCCGNVETGELDNGNLLITNEKNQLCTRQGDPVEAIGKPFTGNKGAWKWINAKESGVPFKIYTINRGQPADSYTAISNMEHWYVCAPKNFQTSDSNGNIAQLGYRTGADGRSARQTDKDFFLTSNALLPLPASNIFSCTTASCQVAGEATRSDTTTPPDEGIDTGTLNPDDTNADPLDEDGDEIQSPADCCDAGTEDKCKSKITNTLASPATIYPGAYDPCEGDDEIDQGCDDTSTTTTCTRASSVSNLHRASRFICTNENNKGIFAECCNGIGCSNVAPLARGIGTPLTSITEFYAGDSTDTANALKINVLVSDITSLGTYSVPVYIDPAVKNGETGLKPADSSQTDWRSFDSLEFYIWYQYNFVASLGIAAGGYREGTNGKGMDHYNIQQFRIKDYAITPPLLQSWVHVKIPLSAIENKDQVNVLFFYFDKSDFEATPLTMISPKTVGRAPNQVQVYNQVIVDRIFLSKNEGNLYCSGSLYKSDTLPNLWINDLDKNEIGGDTLAVGRFACEKTLGNKWTGTQCCGDDAPIDNTLLSSPSNKETYTDTKGACLRSVPLFENKRLGFLDFSTLIMRNSEQSNRRIVCDKKECKLPIFGDAKETKIQNLNNLDLRFVNNYKVASDIVSTIGDTATTPSSMLQAKVALPITYSGGKIRTCQASDVLFDELPGVKRADNSVDNTIAAKRAKYDVPGCTVTSNFFCDNHSVSTWSDEREKGVGVAPNQRNNHSVLPDGEDRLPADQTRLLQTYFDYDGRNEKEWFVEGCCSSTTCWNGTDCVGSVNVTRIGALNAPKDIAPIDESYFYSHRSFFRKNKYFGFTRPNIRQAENDQAFDNYACVAHNLTIRGDSGRPVAIDGVNQVRYAANWTPVYLKVKFNPDSPVSSTVEERKAEGVFDQYELRNAGYCLSSLQCWDGGSCVNPGYVTNDNYCDNGVWTTRTKLLAERMLNLVANNDIYTLYCGPSEDVLNFMDYPEAVPLVKNTAGPNQANSFCALKYQDRSEGANNGIEKVVLGTSLNGVAALDSFLNVVKEGQGLKTGDRPDIDCGSVDPSTFARCSWSESDDLWYYKNAGLVVYSWKGNIGTIGGILPWYEKFILSPLRQVIAWLSRLFASESPSAIGSEGSVSEIHDVRSFTALYLNRNGTHQVLGLTSDSLTEHFMLIEYSNFTNDICKRIDALKQTEFHEISCKPVFELKWSGDVPTPEGKPRYIVRSDDADFDLWNETTALLRLEQGVETVSYEPPRFLSPICSSSSVCELIANIDYTLQVQKENNVQSYYFGIRNKARFVEGIFQGDHVLQQRLPITDGFYTLYAFAVGNDGTFKVKTLSVCGEDNDKSQPNKGCTADDDGDGILDDGDGSGTIGDSSCDPSPPPPHLPIMTSCDDNCPLISNSDQQDNNHNGRGTACDPAEENDPDGDGIAGKPNNNWESRHDKFPCTYSVSSDTDHDNKPDEKSAVCLVSSNPECNNWATEGCIAVPFDIRTCTLVNNVPDQSEFDFGTTPFCLDNDDDNDGLLDTIEPAGCEKSFDCDSDGLLDFEEKNGCIADPATMRAEGPPRCKTGGQTFTSTVTTENRNNLKNPDSDLDGLKDGEEVKNSNPLRRSEPTKVDSDDDSFTIDLVQRKAGSRISLFIMDDKREVDNNLNPKDSDTDNDDMPDGFEFYFWKEYSDAVDHRFNPTVLAPATQDSDNDGVVDKEEARQKTNPLLKDSDNDGYIDGVQLPDREFWDDRDATPTLYTQIAINPSGLNPLPNNVAIRDLSTVTIATNRYGTCRASKQSQMLYAQMEIEFDLIDAVNRVVPFSKQHRSKNLNIVDGTNTLYIRCQDTRGRETDNEFVYTFNADNKQFVINSAQATELPATPFVSSTNPSSYPMEFTVLTSRTASCKLGTDENFNFDTSGIPMPSVSAPNSATGDFVLQLDLKERLKARINSCRQTVGNELYYCEALTEGTASICNSITDTDDSQRDYCRDELVPFIRALRDSCDSLPGELKTFCEKIKENDPVSSTTATQNNFCGSLEGSERSECLNAIALGNAILKGKEYCYKSNFPAFSDQKLCEAIAENKRELCINKACVCSNTVLACPNGGTTCTESERVLRPSSGDCPNGVLQYNYHYFAKCRETTSSPIIVMPVDLKLSVTYIAEDYWTIP